MPLPASTRPAFAFVQPTGAARLRLLCFPHAGGGTALYRSWAGALPPGVELGIALLPGREARLHEPPIDRMDTLVASLLKDIAPYLDRPYALFGHSLGALVAFELARALRAAGAPAPRALLVSANPAPQLVHDDPPIHDLPEPLFLEEIRRYGGMPATVLQSPEL